MTRRGWIVRSGLGTVAALAAARAAEAPGRDAATLVFSARQWQGEYRTDDGPPTPFTSALYVVPAAGGGQPQPLTRLDAAVYWLDWQPL